MTKLLSDEELAKEIVRIFDGGIHGKGKEGNGYPTYFEKPYPLWVQDRLDIVIRLINTQKRLFAESIINEPSDTVKKGDTAFTANELDINIRSNNMPKLLNHRQPNDTLSHKLSKLPEYLGIGPTQWLRIEPDEDIENNRLIWTVTYTNSSIYTEAATLELALDKMYRMLINMEKIS